jgi:hypothetical protein
MISSEVFAQSQDRAALFLSTENERILVGNQTYYDLILNTLGTDVNEIDVQLLLRGPFDRQGMTFNLHPQHKALIQISQPLELVSYDQQYEDTDGVRVRVVLRATDNGSINEGSGAIPVYRIGLKTNGVGQITGYIDDSNSYVRYASPDIGGYNNYSPNSRPRLMDVIDGSNPVVVITTPTPIPTAKPRQTTPEIEIQPKDEQVTKYDQEFEKIAKELADLKTQAEQQERRLSLLEQIVQSLRSFWGKFFK